MGRCPAADTARSMLIGSATLEMRTDDEAAVFLGGYGADGGGRLLLPVAPDNRMLLTAEQDGDVPVQAVLTDVAPVPARRRVRGRLSFTGWAEPLDRDVAERAWRHSSCACSPLGDGERLLRLEPAELVLERDEQPAAEVDLAAFADAEPDPLATVEAELLQHLAHGHPEALAVLVAQLPRALRRGSPRVVPWRLDRHELVLRVERADRDVDVAFPLPHPGATCAREVIDGLRTVVDGRGRSPVVPGAR